MTVVAKVEDLAPGESLAVVVDGVPIALVRDEEGEFHAIGEMCSHGNVSLVDGDVDGVTIECWKHGSTFDLRTGKPCSLPATQPIPVYDVRIDGHEVIVNPNELRNS